MTKFTDNEINLIRRYLIWCYKTTKESLDKIDRYFTQLKVDEVILSYLKNSNDFKKAGPSYRGLVEEFASYMKNKENNVLPKKYSDTKKLTLIPEYHYLKNRFSAIEKAVLGFLGKKELENIERLYEDEMTRRILESRDH